MTDPGLTNRLRQHSRRAGLAVGLTMALAIAVCLGGFVWIFVQIDPFLSDFIAAEENRPAEEAPDATRQAAPESEDGGGDGEEVAQADEEAPEPTATAAPEPTPTAEAFQADYFVSAGTSVNLRAGPGTNFDVITTLFVEQPIMYLGESQETSNPSADLMSPGQVWMKFRTEAGEEGWVRELDVQQTG